MVSPEIPPSFRFPREERLKKRENIREVFKKGRCAACSGAKLFFIPNGLPRNRISFTFSRKFGNAVARNRARRLGREAYRRIRFALKPGYDMVLLVYPGGDAFQDRLDQLNLLCVKAGLFALAGLG
ncbi:MAG: ribonuclease P protein component [Spirochaetaceae bacterium]|nr:ribonuclease P protein component [Spirochaetaceae bacterium]